ncbi:MAG: enoyl-CoA hydratase/isomerase family protein [Burkholderiales bacterium]|nr:enoyl-CoA hydratase/isomerase family protein [Burkholderiales bacterium]
MAEVILTQLHGTSAVIRMNRPEKQNALSRELFEAIDAALAGFDADPAVRGIVITGNDKVFSTGGDLKEALAVRTVEDTRRWLDLFRRVNDRIESIGKPVIAAIHGYCVTGGLEMALACDIRVAASNAQFGITSSRIGTVAGAGGPQRLARLIGPEWTKELLFSGDFIDAETALRIRLVSEVVAPERVLPRALERLESYARRAPLSITYSKAAVNNGLQMPLEYALAYERQITTTLFTTADRREGQAAFLDKRSPNFKGE